VEMTSDEIMAVVEGQTIPSRFLDTVGLHPDWTALRWRTPVDDAGVEGWEQWTYAEYGDLVARTVAGFRELGVTAGSRVVLMMRNCPQFHVLDMAAYFCGATSISIYNSSSVDQSGTSSTTAAPRSPSSRTRPSSSGS
jgi:long-subunit acyl-CoA synthetase (AMP-forming)